ncbi:hypothetical protein H312_03267 [Anncaliia algerae PRA339]|uniref:Uncharacterized protein n=1 Tax=Anncaliia algerae PRA339 TaxID=1288291 RepID=A0A059EWP8_9MICR|nr:hypothetical protein H312_03267 [Anncaliia algerae PRA339]
MLNCYTFFAKIIINSIASLLLISLRHKKQLLKIFLAFGLVVSQIPILLFTIPCSNAYFRTFKHKLFITLTIIVEYFFLFTFYEQFDKEEQLVNITMVSHLFISFCISCMHYVLHDKYEAE